MSNLIKYGVVKNYNQERKFGFIVENETEEEYFFHITDLDKPFPIIQGKTQVMFKGGSNEKGLKAENIRIHTPEIKGDFANIKVSNQEVYLTNSEKGEFLKEQNQKIVGILNKLKSYGIKIEESVNGWISIDPYSMEEIVNPDIYDGHLRKSVPSGYPETVAHVLRILEKQILDFNFDYVNTMKGLKGESQALDSLKSVMLKYPVLNNVRLEAEEKEKTFIYSAESDIIIVTDKAVFLVEIKNYGKKGETIHVSADGRWEICGRYQNSRRSLKNPYKQLTDHIFLINKFFETKGINFELPIIPIIAIANENVDIKLDNRAESFAHILRTEMIGTFVLKYLNENSALINEEQMTKIKNVLITENLPPKKYKVIDYCQNINDICKALAKLLKYWQEDMKMHNERRAEQARIDYKKERRKEHFETGIGIAAFLAEYFFGDM